MDRRYSNPNLSAVDGGIQRGPRLQRPRVHAVNRYNFAAPHGGGRRLPRYHPPRGSPGVFLHETMSHGYTNHYSAMDGGDVGWNNRFQSRESTPFFVDEVCIVDVMYNQFSHVDNGVLRGPRYHPVTDLFPGGVSFTSPAVSYGYGREIDLPIQSLDPEDNNQDLRSTERDNEGGLSEEVIARKLKTRTCDQTTTDDEDYHKICVVCQDDVGEDNQTIGILRCGHEYHASCIKIWLQQKNTCPLCKAIAL